MSIKSSLNHLLLGIACLSIASLNSACGPKLPRVGGNSGKQSQSNDRVAFDKTFGKFQLSCGVNETQLDYRLKTPQGWQGQLFAMILNGSPGTIYFGDTVAFPTALHLMPSKEETGISDNYAGLIEGLLRQGYRVLEVKYDRNPKTCGRFGSMEGFYSVCCGQGIEAVEKHNADLYEAAIQALNYHPDQTDQKLAGFGFSLGGTQVESMAFVSGKKFDRVGITGVIIGKGSAGCGNIVANPGKSIFDGETWTAFVDFADAVTQSTRGCSSLAHFEYNALNSDFSNFKFKFNNTRLGLFEGARREVDSPQKLYGLDLGSATNKILSIPGLDLQAQAIQTARNEASPAVETVLKLYPTCGHEVLYCPGAQGNSLKDILSFFDPQK